MIDTRSVIDALTAVLDAAVEAPVRYLTAPHPAPPVYGVVERPPGDSGVGSIVDSESAVLLRVRIRAVAVTTDVSEAGRAAEAFAVRLRSRLIHGPRITGDGWAVTGAERIASSGVMHEGPAANVVDDYELLVAASTASALP